MSFDSDPPRLADGGGPPELQGLFQSARQDLPSEKALERMLTRLGPIAGAGAALAGDAAMAGAKTAATQAATTSSLGKLMAVLAGAGLIAGGVAVVSFGADEPAASAPATSAPAALPPAAPAPVAPAPPAQTSVAAPEEPQPEPAKAPQVKARSESGPEKDSVKAEAALLERARALAVQNPRQALAITREHARRFPNGLLAQEREVIAIEALRKLGNDDEASKRASKFRETYPGSAHQRTIGATSEK